MKFIKKVYTKLNNKYYRARMHYLFYYENVKIDDKLIMLEAQNGNSINGNIFYILKEISENNKYKDFHIALVIRESKCSSIKKFLEKKEIVNLEIVPLATEKFFKVLASAKYLITDTSLTPNYIKKEGQVLINTWHGTPLKTLGKKVKTEPHTIGNVQKNFIQSDYLLYPNEFMKNHMIEDYMLENICNAKILLTGYPRNTAFFDKKSRIKIKENLNLENKQIIAYMPTWRGSINNIDKEISNTYITYFLLEIDKKLNENQIMYVNLHPFVNKAINYKLFKKIKPFPSNYETYEFLNITDCLITDYSSVFIDYAVTRKKIILFSYDEEEYLKDRGLYLNLKDLPFPNVKTVDNLIKEINSRIDYDDYKFLNKFCFYESKNATKLLCEKIILGQNNKIKEETIKNNGKENVLLYVGNLAKNGITISLKSLLSAIDLDKRNYYITFMTKAVENYKDVLFDLPDKVNYIAIPGGSNGNFNDKVINYLFNKNQILANEYIKLEEKNLNYEIKRLYGNINFSTVIQFNGYEKRNILLFSLFKTNRVIYVHSDMESEVKVRKNQRADVLKYAYSHYDKVAIVTSGILKPTLKFADTAKRIFVVNNLIDYKNILAKSIEEIELNSDTVINIDFEKLMEILNNKKFKKFINIGRFSKEKGQERLIDAFNAFYLENTNNYLIIIGGHGNEYTILKEKIKNMECCDHVILIKSITNPYSILNKCDYFVLSSFYEGFGLVLAEADILNKPLISTDIPGPKDFIIKNNGTLVENTEFGLYKGMKLLSENKIKPMKVNYQKYNEMAISQFEILLDNSKINKEKAI